MLVVCSALHAPLHLSRSGIRLKGPQQANKQEDKQTNILCTLPIFSFTSSESSCNAAFVFSISDSAVNSLPPKSSPSPKRIERLLAVWNFQWLNKVNQPQFVFLKFGLKKLRYFHFQSILKLSFVCLLWINVYTRYPIEWLVSVLRNYSFNRKTLFYTRQ